MGTRGPVPKRSSERRRRNSPAVTVAPALEMAATAPAPPDGLHPLALSWYDSLAKSGQSQFYEPSDWQVARIVAVVMTRMLAAPQLSAPLFTAVLQGWRDLLVTESARRRVGMEIQRDQPVRTGVSYLDDIRARLNRGGQARWQGSALPGRSGGS